MQGRQRQASDAAGRRQRRFVALVVGDANGLRTHGQRHLFARLFAAGGDQDRLAVSFKEVEQGVLARGRKDADRLGIKRLGGHHGQRGGNRQRSEVGPQVISVAGRGALAPEVDQLFTAGGQFVGPLREDPVALGGLRDPIQAGAIPLDDKGGTIHSPRRQPAESRTNQGPRGPPEYPSRCRSGSAAHRRTCRRRR